VQRIITGLAVLVILLGATSPSLATWVWYENRWVYVDEAEPPRAPQAPGERSKPAAIAPTPDNTAAPPTAPSPAPVAAPAPAAPKASPATATLSAQAATDLRPAVMPTDVGKREGAAKPEPGLEGELFEQGRSELAAGDFSAGAKTLRKLIDSYPTARQREDAMWLRAVALLAASDPYAAFEQLEELVTQYAGSPHFQEALGKEMKIAEAFLTGTHRKVLGMTSPFSAEDEGLAILRKVYEHQPTGDLADDVVKRVADYYWDGHKWSEAEDYYDKYCHEFPNGPAVKEAEYRRAKCTIERCRGPLYDTTGLQTAYDRLKQFQQKYLDEAGRENVDGLLANIRSVQAQSLYETAAHYRRAGRPTAAALYAERLRERYPETPWAEKAVIFLPPEAVKEGPGPVMEEAKPVKEEPNK
jgi:outer membrane protein assembly factor BamD (BamD/ComL family)